MIGSIFIINGSIPYIKTLILWRCDGVGRDQFTGDFFYS